jgi:hypothetical protein
VNKWLLSLIVFMLIIIVFILLRKQSITPDISDHKTLETKDEQAPPELLLERIKKHPGLESAQLSAKEKESSCRSAIEMIETMPLNTI